MRYSIKNYISTNYESSNRSICYINKKFKNKTRFIEHASNTFVKTYDSVFYFKVLLDNKGLELNLYLIILPRFCCSKIKPSRYYIASKKIANI